MKRPLGAVNPLEETTAVTQAVDKKNTEQKLQAAHERRLFRNCELGAQGLDL